MIGISSKTIYGITALNELSRMQGDNVLKIKEIAANASIPQNFLEQILLALKKQGILISIKGAYGGYRLAKDLKDISLRDVMLILETDIFSDICKTDNPALKLFWKDLKKNLSDTFDIPLSELKNYQLKATESLDYSI